MSLILMTGGSGLIGTNLTRHLAQRGHEVVILTRNRKLKSTDAGITYSYWAPQKGIIDVSVLQNCDHIIHLAGAGVMDKKWTDEYKQVIVDSRTKTARLLVDKLRETSNKVKTFVSASAIGYYGRDSQNQSKESFTENDLPAKDFLAQTCFKWEAASQGVEDLGIRRVILRQGVVLSDRGGAYKEFKMPLKFGVATIFGAGKQMISWVHIDDLSKMYSSVIENEHFKGVYNAVAPAPVPQKKFMVSLGEKVRGKFFITIHVPVVILRLMLGERSIEILKSATVSARKIREAGFKFLYPELRVALDELEQ